MEQFHRGAHWTSALAAADATLPQGRQLSGRCRLADGQFAYFGRWRTSGYMTQLPAASREFRSRESWREGLEEQLVRPRLCRALVVTVNRDFEFDVSVDDGDDVLKVEEMEDR
jgi:hypothetical protein